MTSAQRQPHTPTSEGTTMRAVVSDVYGEAADVLRVEQVERPAPGPGEVLIRVQAAGVDQGVWHVMAGLPYPIRLAGYGLRTPRTRVRGSNVAGVVETVGDGVTTVRPGDDVFGVGEGAFAEYAVAPEAKLCRTPAGLPARVAAAVPVSGITALQAVRDHGRVQPGQRVLVLGAGGGVGSFAVQIAKAHGADVTAATSRSKTDLARALGADTVLDYTREDVTDGRQTYDVVLDVGGNRPLRQLRRALTPRGTLVIVGGETDGRWLGGTERLVRAMLLNPFVGQTLRSFVASENAADLAVLAGLIESGEITPAVDRSFPLAEAAAAIEYLRAGKARGKVVLEI
jgi:NADPH:quinone reductase-like Zn-dependent oxidoreductase